MKAKAIFLILLLFCICCSRTAPLSEPLRSINISVPYELDTLDPHAKTRLNHFAILFNFYEPLVSIDENLKIQPCLATQWENPDLYTWIFHLRDGVRFHNGKMLQAEDVVYTFNRLINSKNLDISTYLNDVESIEEITPLALRVRTRNPLPIFLNRLNYVRIIPKGSTAEVLAEHADGTGPYRLVRWKKGENIRMAVSKNYWAPKSFLQEVTYFLGRTPEAALQDAGSGKFHLVACNSKKLEEKVRTSRNFRILFHDSLMMKYLSFDVSREVTPYCKAKTNPFKNPWVRQAIHRAIDRKRLIADLPTFASPASQPVPPFVFGYHPGIVSPDCDLTEARKLMARAGFPDGFEVTLHVRQILKETGDLVKSHLSQIGIRLNPLVLPDSEFFAVLDSHKVSFFLSRVGATVGDASDVLEPQLHSPTEKSHLGVRNYIGYFNPKVDEAIEESARILKTEVRRGVLQGIMSILMEDLPWIPLYIDQDVYAVDRSLSWQPRADSLVLALEIRTNP